MGVSRFAESTARLAQKQGLDRHPAPPKTGLGGMTVISGGS